MGAYRDKQQLREDYESATNPKDPAMAAALTSPLMAALVAVRSGINLMRHYTDTEGHNFPSEEHREITKRIMAGMGERMTAFELELLNAAIDLAWEINECTCDHCKQVDLEIEAEDRARKAKYN